MTKRKHIVSVTGESALVREFVENCAQKQYEIVGTINEKTTRLFPPGMKKVSTFSRTSAYAFELTNSAIDVKKKNLIKLDRTLTPSAPILSSAVTVSATEQASWMRHPERLIGISAFPTLLSKQLIELAPTINTSTSSIQHAVDFFKNVKKDSVIVQDRIGMVMPRILCMLINEAAFALGDQLASPQDIDTAMRLGTNYPFGPVEWADKIGVNQIISVLDALYNDLHEERYRVAPLLKRLAIGKKWWSV